MRTQFIVFCLSIMGLTAAFGQSKGPCGLGELIGKGAEITIVGIHSEDAYFENKEDYIGKKGVTTDNLSTYNDACYYTGAVKVEGIDEEAFFLAVKITVQKDGIIVDEADDIAAVAPDEEDAVMEDEIPIGSVVKIVGIGKGDSYFDNRDEVVGITGTVKESCTKDTDETYYAGGITSLSGKYYYFAEVDLVVLEKGSGVEEVKAVDKGTSHDIPQGTKVKIVGLDSGDAYYEDRKEIVGVEGVCDAGCEQNDDGSYSGSIKGKNGKSYYFANVRLEVIK